MDVIDFVKTAIRICSTIEHGYCYTCPFANSNFCIENTLGNIDLETLGEAAHIAEKWAKEHPIKTKGTEFVKAFPHAQLGEDGYSAICPNALDKTWKCRKTDCKGCRANFWNQEV